MSKRSFCQILAATLPFALAAAYRPARAADPVKDVRLYAIDCGRILVSDMGAVADTGEYDGKPVSVVASCYLIRHPKGTLLWDTGLSDNLAESKDGVQNGIFKLSVTKGLIDQLKSIGVTPSEVTYVAFSHLHFDHTGNANAFASATWILNEDEIAWAETTPTPLGVDPGSFSTRKAAMTQMINGDHDVFGDGTVRILKAPGYTPGHGVLEVKLRKSGYVTLSGDLYHTRENRKFKRVPRINTERADTLASMDRVERIVKNTRARFMAQHDVKDFEGMPRFPAFLE
jgi:glyoxylase-like metal-dependent hydrolase (beta-lactamase superfamily II)